MVDTWLTVLLFSLLFGMFELFRIKIKMLKIKIVNLFIFPVKWHFLYLPMVDFITCVLLKYFNDDHTKKMWQSLLFPACSGGEGGWISFHVRVSACAYVKVWAHKRLTALGIGGQVDSGIQDGKERDWRLSVAVVGYRVLEEGVQN